MASFKISILSDSFRGTSFSLSGDSYSIGRGEDADISIPDKTISSHHCTLIKTADGSFALKDEGSTNGTKVNGTRLESNQPPVALSNGDILQLGDIEILFEDTDARASSAKKPNVIDMDETGTILISEKGMKNLGQKSSSKHSGEIRENKSLNALFIGVLAVLFIAAACGVAYLLLMH